MSPQAVSETVRVPFEIYVKHFQNFEPLKSPDLNGSRTAFPSKNFIQRTKMADNSFRHLEHPSSSIQSSASDRQLLDYQNHPSDIVSLNAFSSNERKFNTKVRQVPLNTNIRSQSVEGCAD